MVGGIFVNIADDLIARLKGIAVGDQANPLRGVLDEGEIVRRRLQHLCGRVAQSGQPLFIRDVRVDRCFPRNRRGDLGVRSAYGLPVLVGCLVRGLA